MPKYKRRPTLNESLPGLFDEFEIDMTREELPVHPSIERHATRVMLSGGIRKSEAAGDNSVEPLQTPDIGSRLKFISFGSGSSGNCAFIGDDNGGFLIDAGVDPAKILPELRRHGIKTDKIAGIILTHDHGDHVRYAYALLRRNSHMLLYCTPKAFNGILRRHNISRRIKDYHKAIYKEIPFDIGDFRLTAFEVQHDGSDNAGFFIEHGTHTFAVATDLGCISQRADFYMRQARYIMIESNYDREMLVAGHYPEYLKARILADNGHLDNEDAATYIASIYTPRLTYVFLCHLSHDNNTPEKATDAMKNALQAKGVVVGDGSDSIESREAPVQVMALPRFEPTRMFIFR